MTNWKETQRENMSIFRQAIADIRRETESGMYQVVLTHADGRREIDGEFGTREEAEKELGVEE